MEVLVIGDPHATLEEMGDVRSLFKLVVEVVRERRPALVVYLGDQNHHHGIVHVGVMEMWRELFLRVRAAGQGQMLQVVMRGNHDAAAGQTWVGMPHALLAFMDMTGVIVVDEPTRLCDVLGFMPYCSSAEEFLSGADLLYGRGASVLFCHQTFGGVKYENGFYATDGIDPDLVKQAKVISGHIHTPQSFGNVWYPGAPRWRTRADANVRRAIHLVTVDDAGNFVKTEPFDTSPYCRVIAHTVLRDGAVVEGPSPPALEDEPPCDWYLDAFGSNDANRALRAVAHPAWRIRTFDTDAATPAVRESVGVDRSFEEYLGAYVPKHGTSKETLADAARSRMGWKS